MQCSCYCIIASHLPGTVFIPPTVSYERVVGGPREGEVYVAHEAPPRQNTPHPGTRPEQLSEPPGPQRSDRTVRHSAGRAPSLAPPALAAAADDAVDSATVSFLLQVALSKEEEEREQAAKVEEKLEVLLSIPDNQLTLPQQRRRAEHFRSGAAQAFLAAVTEKEKEKMREKMKKKKKKKRRRTRSRTKWTPPSCSS